MNGWPRVLTWDTYRYPYRVGGGVAITAITVLGRWTLYRTRPLGGRR